MADRRTSSSLLSLIASRAIVPGGIQQSIESKRQAEEQQMMYAIRMTYLATDAGSQGPDTLFLTRKRAQKLAHRQDSIKMPVRKLDTSSNGAFPVAHSLSQPQLQLHSPSRKSNVMNAVGSGATGAGSMTTAGLARKKSRNLLDDDAAGRRLTWEPKFQAGCHFWQCVETGECRVDAPPGAQCRGHQRGRSGVDDADDDEDDPPFPESFAFLEHKST